MDRIRFSATLIELRKEMDLTQQDFADLFSVTFQAVSKWETGESIPDIATLEKISEFYKISINDLLNGNKLTLKKNRVEVEEKTVEEKPRLEKQKKMKINLSKIIFSSCALVVFLLLGLIPFVRVFISQNVYVSSDYYKVVFSADVLYGNFMFLLDFFVFVAACIFGILAGVFKEIKVFSKLEHTFALYHALFLLSYSFMFITIASAGLYVMTLYGLVYFLIILFAKPFNNIPYQENPKMIIWIRSAFVLYTTLFTIGWIFAELIISEARGAALVACFTTAILIVFHLVLCFKKNKTICALFYISFGVTIASYFAINLFSSYARLRAEFFASFVLATTFVIFESVLYNFRKHKIKEANI